MSEPEYWRWSNTTSLQPQECENNAIFLPFPHWERCASALLAPGLPVLVISSAALGWQRDGLCPCSFSFPTAWWNWCGQGAPAQSGALAQVLFRAGVDIRSTTGFHLLLRVPPLDLLPRLFGGSPGSDLTVTATFISCSLGKWCKGKRFLHPLHITYQAIAESALLCLDLDLCSPYSSMPLFITSGLQNGRGKNVSNVDFPCFNHKLCVRPMLRPTQWNTWD